MKTRTKTIDFRSVASRSILIAAILTAGYCCGVSDSSYAQTDINQAASNLVMDKSNANVYVVWQTDSGEVWFSTSQDKGITFSGDIKLSSALTGINRNPALATDQTGNIYAVWENQGTDSNLNLYFARLLKGNQAFEVSMIPVDAILGASSNQLQPTIDASGTGTVVIAWVNKNGINDGLYTSISTNQGLSFKTIASAQIKRVDDGSSQSPQNPCIRMDAAGQNSPIAWDAVKGGTRKIFFNKFNSSNTKVYANDIQISDDATSTAASKPWLATRPSTTGTGKVDIGVVWENTFGSDTNIAFDKSSTGQTWGTDVQVNDDSNPSQAQKEPKIGIDANGDIYAVWTDMRNGDWDIYCTYSIDNGISFKTSILVNADTGNAVQDKPSLYISADGNNLCMSWTDYRSGSGEIYYNRNAIYDDTTSVSSLVNSTSGGVIKVNSPTTLIDHTEVVIPTNVLPAAMNITITQIDFPPAFQNGDTQLNKALDIGPSGMTFSQPVTLKIPYTQADLDGAGITDASSLKVYYYNLKTLFWEQIPGSYVDTAQRLVCAPVSHFSIFGLGAPAAVISSATGGGGGGSGGGGGCFIATAAYGSYNSDEVRVLRVFRDQYLLTNRWGSEFVKFYYRHSPPIARYIADKEDLKRIVRLTLKPLVAVIRQHTPSEHHGK